MTNILVLDPILQNKYIALFRCFGHKIKKYATITKFSLLSEIKEIDAVIVNGFTKTSKDIIIFAQNGNLVGEKKSTVFLRSSI